MEKRLLQTTIALAGLVPVLAGAAGAIWSPLSGAGFIDSQFRYLSGLLLGVGLAYWTLIPRIERQGDRLFVLTMIVVVGGFCRAVGLLIDGPAGVSAYVALAIELILAPCVYVWQIRIAERASMDAAPAQG